ncbi:hypothetical protein [Paludisphaera sp.]|uniref:hypothetical protein n=1 Tax=Paludisphaera sp. TaxID=2017432 RepID=UPI00301E0760
MTPKAPSSRALALALTLAFLAPAVAPADESPLGAVRLPKEWQDKFWAAPQAEALLKLSPKEAADLVPKQAGIRFCGCPACGIDEREEPLSWSIDKPKVVVCRECKGEFPGGGFPAAPTTENVEVRRGVWHLYPYHAAVPEKAHYPEERLYLAAKVDYEARAYLSKAALYAAVRWHDEEPAKRDPKLAQLAATLLLRFAQVYPDYAMRTDQPGQTKQLMPAKVPPPYRHAYQTAKWEWNGSLETPMNLVLAYSLLRDGADWDEVGKLLGDEHPRHTIENDLLLASAELASRQPDDYTEDSLVVYRGMLSVGRLIGNRILVHEAGARLEEFSRRAFYYDGFWRGADVLGHRRVLGMLDGWIDGLLERPATSAGDRPVVPMLDLARAAASAVPSRPVDPEIRLASWPVEKPDEGPRRPMLLGGAGLALLSVGRDDQSLDVEVRGRDGLTDRRGRRLAFRLSVGGVPLLDDLDERPATANGWDLATASHNTVVVDGLNQRESPQAARIPTPSSDFLFFSPDADLQVVTAADRHAYPVSTKLYRQTFAVSGWGPRRYAVSVFEVEGGLQHDQIFHSAPGSGSEWKPLLATAPAVGSLLPPSITFLPTARPEDGRWFVQAYGEFKPRLRASLDGPSRVDLAPRGGGTPSLRLHLLGASPATLIAADSSDAPAVAGGPPNPAAPRSSLIVRRRSQSGANLASLFVTLFEPMRDGLAPLDRVGRVETTADAVVIAVEAPEGTEHLVFNRKAGAVIRAQLANGRGVETDGLLVRVRGDDVTLVGGTYAEASGMLVSQPSVRGTIVAAGRSPGEGSRGYFVTPEELPEGLAVAGRALFVQHGDGTTRAWTLAAAEPTAEGTRLHVREEPGFLVDEATGAAEYYQFPMAAAPGPHRFRLALSTRGRTPTRGVAAVPPARRAAGAN